MSKQLNIGIIGAGVVGSEVVRLIDKNNEIYSQRLGKTLSIKGIYTRNPGGEKSIDIFSNNPGRFIDSAENIINDPDIDIVVETMGGLGIARNIIEQSIRSGKSVVTANKDLISTYGSQIIDLANSNNVGIGIEASVAGGIPIINALSNGLSGDRIIGLRGIINGTCNYIITKLKENPNLSYKDVLLEAQNLGYAESDPTNDVEGIDSFYKLSILSGIGFGKILNRSDTDIKGISSIDGIDFYYAKILNRSIKLLGVLKLSKENILDAFVGPVLINNNNPLASINGVTNALDVIGINSNNTFSGPGAGGKPTASSVISDIINIGSKINSEGIYLGNNICLNNDSIVLGDNQKIKSKYYCRFVIEDGIGIMHATTGILLKYGISLDQVLQHSHGDDEKGNLPYVMTLETTEEGNLRKAISEIDKLPFIKSPTFVMRILD